MLPDYYLCRCGVKHLFSSYVYANWGFIQRHICDGCGRLNRLLEGELLPDEETTETPKPARKIVNKRGPASKKSSVKKEIRPKEGED